jgi:glycosyltransferase involved in cell wall biosynthesis
LHSGARRVCVVIQDFPTAGGVGTVLQGIEEVMKDYWQVEYLTQYVGLGADRYIIHKFGTRRMTPWYFPFVWLYVLSGIRKFISLMRHEARFDLILPQDGVFSGALAGIAGKLTGVRVVCIDHGDLSLFTPRNKRILQAERIAAIAKKNWPWAVRLLSRKLLVFYWPSRYLLACIAARFIDHYLIPGVPGDSVDEGCQIIGIHPSRVTRYRSMIDMRHHVLPDAASKAAWREQKGLPADARVVTIACRLAPEKGLDSALHSLYQALPELAPTQRQRVRVVIAGHGPLRKQVEDDILRYGLSEYCSLWGELSSSEVIELLGGSDVFLYTSTRGACYAMAILEAMASACAVIASTEPLSNALLLAEGRGYAVPPNDVDQISQALVSLLNEEQHCQQMGRLAREYIAAYHSPELFRRELLEATGQRELLCYFDQPVA